MIYLVEKDNGDIWDDYRTWIDSVWNVQDGINVELQYREFIQSNLNKFNIKLDNSFEHFLSPVIDNPIPQYGEMVLTKENKKLLKQFKKIVKQHSIEDYLTSIGAIRLEFKELHY
jgi:hypothetical protein